MWISSCIKSPKAVSTGNPPTFVMIPQREKRVKVSGRGRLAKTLNHARESSGVERDHCTRWPAGVILHQSPTHVTHPRAIHAPVSGIGASVTRGITRTRLCSIGRMWAQIPNARSRSTLLGILLAHHRSHVFASKRRVLGYKHCGMFATK